MFLRKDLKTAAKKRLVTRYWGAFGVSFVVIAFSAVSRALKCKFSLFDLLTGKITLDDGIRALPPSLVLAGIALATAYGVFVLPVIDVGVRRWFSQNRESAGVPLARQIFSLFSADRYMPAIGSMLWMNLFIALWSLPPLLPAFSASMVMIRPITVLYRQFGGIDAPGFRSGFLRLMAPYGWLIGLTTALCLIPSIYKWISYGMTPWILADNPRIGYRRALKLSVSLTRGQTWRIFVLFLSFTGWLILAALPVLLGYPFLIPYMNAVFAELYAVLRQNGLNSGQCTAHELGRLIL